MKLVRAGSVSGLPFSLIALAAQEPWAMADAMPKSRRRVAVVIVRLIFPPGEGCQSSSFGSRQLQENVMTVKRRPKGRGKSNRGDDALTLEEWKRRKSDQSPGTVPRKPKPPTPMKQNRPR